MDVTGVALALFEFLLTVLMAVGVVYVNYRLAIRSNSDYDTEQELQNRNMGVAILLAACLVSAGLIVKNGIFPIISMIRLSVTSGGTYLSLGVVAVLASIQLVLVFVSAIISVSLSLRLFGKLTRRIHEGRELQLANPAVGTILAAVVLVVAMFVADSMSAVTKALVPQATLGSASGTIEIMR